MYQKGISVPFFLLIKKQNLGIIEEKEVRMSEITSTGVITKTLDEWYEAVVNFKRAVWGDDFVTDPTTKQGADMLQLAELLYNAEMNNVSAFAQLNLNTATGICLDYIGLVRGIQRDGGYPQQIVVDLTSSITGYVLTPDVVFRTTTGYSYYVPASVTITDYSQQVTLVYSSDGNPDVSEGDPLQTVASNTNIISAVIAQGGITPGADTEDDSSYRKRIQDADIGFIGTLELMASEMAKVAGMAKLNILYNDSSSTDTRGIPAYCTEFLCVPQDGVDDTTFNSAVANKILEVKVPGAPLNGNTTVTVPDYFGEDKTVKFTRSSKVGIQFYARIKANPVTGVLSTSNLAVEIQAIIDYVQNIDVGDKVSWSRILGMIAADQGFVIDGTNWGLRKGTSGAWLQEDLTCGVREYFWIEEADIDISTTAPGNL